MNQPASGPAPDRADLVSYLGVAVTPELLELALTHRSYAYEHGGIRNNERLEFLGDSILGQAVTVMLYTENPDLDEGDLAKRRASLVSTVALAEVAEHIGLGRYVLLGRGEEMTGGRQKHSILADTVEAVIGATYLDAGPQAATGLVMRLIAPLLANPDRFGAAMDPKTSLQELSSSLGRGMPNYVISDSGPDHDKRFHAIVRLGKDEIASGVGSSKKAAEMGAALEAWTLLSAPASAAAGVKGSADILSRASDRADASAVDGAGADASALAGADASALAGTDASAPAGTDADDRADAVGGSR